MSDNALGRVYHTDGTADYLRAEGKTWALIELQEAVGGYIEVVPLPHLPTALLIVNEDGQRLALPPNPAASLVAGQRIVGDAVLVAREHME